MTPRLLYRCFPLAARTSRWLEERCTAAGRLLLGLLIAGAVLGIDLNQTLAYQLAAMAFALLVASLLVSVTWRPRLRIARVLPDLVTACQPGHYWLEITNLGTRVESDLVLQERLADAPLPYARFATRTPRPRDGGNWFDRAVGYPRWIELRNRLRGARIALTEIPPLPPGETVRVKVALEPLRRGWLRFDEVTVMCPDPLGLCRTRRDFALPGALLALPRRHAVPALRQHAGQRDRLGATHLARAVGNSQEFAGLRDYQAGDARRHIHWRSFAKTGQLIVKQFQDEYAARHALVVDLQGTDAPARFEAVLEVAASLVSGPRATDAALDLLIAGPAVVTLGAAGGGEAALVALRHLAEAQPQPGTDCDALTALVEARLESLASVILVLGRDDPSRRALVRKLLLQGLTVRCLLVVEDDAESTPGTAFGPGWHRLRVGHLPTDLAALEGW
ncbi:MAG: DUF58 domain-containing protein [Gammaproteobacteria bacterium]